MSTVDTQEVAKFSRIASEWWDEDGKFAPLHRINPARIAYLLEKTGPVRGLRLLDIGCGGGLVCEPFARLGAHVTGIDASAENIAAASLHAQSAGLSIEYRCTTAEETQGQFDVVLALEIVEHVADVEAFVRACMALVRPGGLIIFSTMSRTMKAYALAIVGAEYVLRWLPRGTHDWKKFLRPSELVTQVERAGGSVSELAGLSYNPMRGEWHITRDLAVNYFCTASKTS